MVSRIETKVGIRDKSSARFDVDAAFPQRQVSQYQSLTAVTGISAPNALSSEPWVA